MINTALIGLGNVGRNFLRILETRAERIEAEYGLRFRVVCVADSSGVAVDPAGYDPATVRTLKEQGGRVCAARLPPRRDARCGAGDAGLRPGARRLPGELATGEPGLSAVRAALGRGIPVVLANKAPLVLAFHELHDLARRHNTGLGFSATVCGALPVINIGRRDLVAARVARLRGIFNSTSNFILGEMAAGRAYADALAEAQRRGIAETDPTLDVAGWDTANKLVIIANSFLGVRVGLADVQVTGITGVTTADLQAALARGDTIKLVASAQYTAAATRSPWRRRSCRRATSWAAATAGRWASRSTATSTGACITRSGSGSRCRRPPQCCGMR
jgi:homoserine dehydrogenase